MKREFFIFFIFFGVNCFSRESIILKRNIFTAPLPPSKIETPSSILKPQSLPPLESLIEISGIVYFPYGISYAIIKNKKTNVEEIYKEKDSVEQAKIVKIEIDKVYFEYDNKIISLKLEYKLPEGGVISLKSDLEEKQKVNIDFSQTPPIIISRNVDFENVMTALVNDKNFIQNLNLIPNVNEEGKIEGFKVFNLPENSIPYQYGLRNGDIIRKVNGTLIDSMATAFNVYNQIKNSNVDVVTVEILRNNRPLFFNYRLNRK